MVEKTTLSIREFMAHAPVDLNLKNDHSRYGYAFTIHPDIAPGAPAYREPANLAAWWVGYLSGMAAAEKENN